MLNIIEVQLISSNADLIFISIINIYIISIITIILN